MGNFAPQIKIPALYMRGGTSKGVFFKRDDLLVHTKGSKDLLESILLRVIGSPDPYQKHTDGMGGATSSTSKCVILSKANNPSYDVDYEFAQIAIDKPMIDWSGNCGNLSAAVGAAAIEFGYVDTHRIPHDGICEVKIWQQNIQKTIIAHVPISNGVVQETGNFELDGVTFPAAEVRIDFIDPADAEGALFPTGNLVDKLKVPEIGVFDVTYINSGIPTMFINAEQLGFQGTEQQSFINQDTHLLARLETIRAHGGVAMGLLDKIEDAEQRQHTPKLAFVSSAKSYYASSGVEVKAESIDLCVRAMSMGKLHHAMMGTAAVAIASAAVIPGTLVNKAAGSGELIDVTFGHPSGVLKVGAKAVNKNGQWYIKSVSMSRSARVLMEGNVRVSTDSCS